jgi:serine palmitoyltransferase
VDEWTPESLGAPLTTEEENDLASIPVISGPNGPRPKLVNTGKQVLNLASYNFTGLAGNETIKKRAIETLRKYGVGSCGPPGFHGTIGMSVPSRCSRPRRLNGHLQMCTWTLSAT